MWDWDEPKRQATSPNMAWISLCQPGLTGQRRRPDTRWDYGEERFESVGFIGKRLFVLVFTPRGEKRRLISLRKANSREVARWLT